MATSLSHVLAQLEARPLGAEFWLLLSPTHVLVRAVSGTAICEEDFHVGQDVAEQFLALFDEIATVPEVAPPEGRRIFGLTTLYVIAADSGNVLHESRAPELFDSERRLFAWGRRLRDLIATTLPGCSGLAAEGFVISAT